MSSLFVGTDTLICEALSIQSRDHLNRQTLRIDPISSENSFRLVNKLYDRMTANFSDRLYATSEMLWRCRCATEIRDDNRNPETILEKAVANLAHVGHMPDWFNQCPVASGITDSSKDRRRAIDLIHLSKRKARLVELKWASNTPAYALFEVLEYGLSYVFARLHAREFHLENQRLMQVDQVGLEVVGPREFYENEDQWHLFANMNRAVAKFVTEKTRGAVSMSLRALSFPAGFDRIPFDDGMAVKEKCRNAELSDEASLVRHAFSQLGPAS